MRLIRRCHQAFVQHCLGIVVGAHAALFHHDLNFLRKYGVVDDQVGHPVGFELHGQFQFVLVHLLKVSSMVTAGERIFASARSGDAFGKLTCRDIFSTLEHHMLEHMRDTRGAVEFIDSPGAIPDLRDHDRRAAIFLDDHAQPVGQGGIDNASMGYETKYAQQ